MPSSISAGFPRRQVVTINLPLNTHYIDHNLFIADAAYRVVGITYVHSTANGTAAKFQITKCTGTTAPASGTALLTNNSAAGFDAAGTANTVQTATFGTTDGITTLKPGDRLAIDVDSATYTAVRGGVLAITLKRLGA